MLDLYIVYIYMKCLKNKIYTLKGDYVRRMQRWKGLVCHMQLKQQMKTRWI